MRLPLRSLFFLVPALLAGACPAAETPHAASTVVATPNPFDLAPPRHRAILAAIRLQNPGLIVIGDSITHQFGGVPSAVPDHLQDLGAATWARYYAPRRAVNLGVNGDKTVNILWRLQNGELEGIAPKVAMLMAGFNDATVNGGTPPVSPEAAADGVAAIIAELHKRCPGTKILLLGVLPTAIGTPELQAFPAKVNRILAERHKAYGQTTYIDMTALFLDAKGGVNRALLYDGMHPSPAGYAVWAEAVEPTLARLMGDTPATKR